MCHRWHQQHPPLPGLRDRYVHLAAQWDLSVEYTAGCLCCQLARERERERERLHVWPNTTTTQNTVFLTIEPIIHRIYGTFPLKVEVPLSHSRTPYQSCQPCLSLSPYPSLSLLLYAPYDLRRPLKRYSNKITAKQMSEYMNDWTDNSSTTGSLPPPSSVRVVPRKAVKPRLIPVRPTALTGIFGSEDLP
jgi:hypothetical protein